MRLTGLLGRIVYSVLYGLVAFVVLLIIGLILNKVGLGDIGSIVTKFAAVIGLLVGLGYFFSNRTPAV